MSTPLTFGRYDYATFSCFIAYAACSLAIPVALVQLAVALDFRLDAGGKGAGGALQLARSLPMVLAMLGCGFAAGRWGKIKTLAAATACMGVGLVAAAVAPSYGLLFAVIAIAGTGEGIVEGLATPVIQDLHPDEPGRHINFTHGFWSVGVVMATLAAGGLLAMGCSWRIVLALCGLTAVVPTLLYGLPYRGPQRPDRPLAIPFRTVWEQARELFQTRRFWLFFTAMFLAGGGEFGLTFWIASLIQLEYGGSAFLGGLGTAVFAGGMIVGRMASGFLMRQHHLRPLIVGSAAAGTLLCLLPPLLHSLPLFLGVAFLIGIASGPFWPSIQSYCVDCVPGDSTMIYILLSCAGVPGCGVFAWLMGLLGDWFGLRAAFFLIPACYAALGLLIGWDGRRAAPAPHSP